MHQHPVRLQKTVMFDGRTQLTPDRLLPAFGSFAVGERGSATDVLVSGSGVAPPQRNVPGNISLHDAAIISIYQKKKKPICRLKTSPGVQAHEKGRAEKKIRRFRIQFKCFLSFFSNSVKMSQS